MAEAVAPGKVILCGEHFVVYGEPAIVAAIDLKAYAYASLTDEPGIHIYSSKVSEDALQPIREVVKLLVESKDARLIDKGLMVSINSGIPISAGLGSSAAVAVASILATSKLLGLKLKKREIVSLGVKAEEIIHGRPSGIDPTISVYGGILLFKPGGKIRRIKPAKPVELVIADSGLKRSTGVMVRRVGELASRYPDVFSRLRSTVRMLVRRAVEAIIEGDIEELGGILNMNHGLLSAIGVSNSRLEKLVYAAREAGALGSKVTGAGGGGCIIALARPRESDRIASSLVDAGAEAVYKARILEVGAM
ncbi:MAG: mevalonate kinase [Nitrososphaerota archaeon]|nr:mevalonate kinase [Candidatus Bathyarchaeota archaeon]MCX8161505.1 mevalonate kinase [Candidatus Bathyarchaeota archaeon]MDW8061613.1 mevalonate kinase [Nitrososphaerota archaeon]